MGRSVILVNFTKKQFVVEKFGEMQAILTVKGLPNWSFDDNIRELFNFEHLSDFKDFVAIDGNGILVIV